ncbi:MAG: hypothetical protein LC778_21540, partial [Acidobacteria bacterium]|nr:hypothetical protein [Acidobacteriota bacterium]
SYIFTGTVLAEKINLTLQDAPLTILKGGTATKKINGIPNNTPGFIGLDIKWHAMTFVPNVFNKLKIELLHGTRVLLTKECYSKHSDKEPKCYLPKSVDQTEADAAGNWKLRVTNNSNEDVNGFNIVKEITDLNPFVTNIVSTFEPDCSIRYLTLQGGGKVEIAPHSTVERDLFGVLSRAGEVHIRAKWHTDTLGPNVFRALRVEVLRNGTVVKTDYGYSIHSDESDKLDIKFNVSANQSGNWKLKITNDGSFKLIGFDIEKGSEINPILSKTDLNPFVPQFRSTFKPSCN